VEQRAGLAFALLPVAVLVDSRKRPYPSLLA
jgi:hypothetical protein